jgi:hypothetical protein
MEQTGYVPQLVGKVVKIDPAGGIGVAGDDLRTCRARAPGDGVKLVDEIKLGTVIVVDFSQQI